ncbi:hypothetical protein AMK59_1255 [Oryctes borbonicus]|uniref:Uncharacterized protein n=1 Tax=Oryctes borbonicus TaxID=1629725 RepID=A0A0T6BHC6_9SCAR|nr:hypothetical protein AMK59_1255 [Oryctes borbonicus]
MKTKKAAMVKKVSEKSKVKKPVKKRKLTQRQLNEMSETISFVIKGKLTPINPVVNQSKFKKQKRQSLRVIELQQAGLPNKTKNKEPSNRKNKPIKEEANVGDESTTTLVKEEGSKKRVTTKKIREPTIVPNKAKNPKASRSKKVKPVTNSLVKVKNQTKTSPKRQKCNIKQEPVETEEDKKHPEKVEIKKTTKPAKPKSALPTPRKVIKKPIKRIKKEAEVTEEKPELVNIKTEDLPSHINDLSPDETSTNSDEITLNLLRQQNIEKKPEEIKREPEEKVEKSRAVKKSPVKNKQVILRKKIITNTKDKIKRKGDQRRKMKLFALWNGPKRHRVASLNALAKVHCLYENEGRGSIIDNIQPIKRESSEKKDKEKKEKVERKEKVEKAEKKEKVEKKEKEKVEKSDKVEETVEIVNEEPNVPARNLRTAPGLRGMGKHWDMHDTTSSSEDTGCESSTEVQEVKTKKEPPKKAETERKPPVKRRKRTEIIMDLKDMVVRKRMASLNASAILAASYSLEKNASRSPKSSSDSDSDSDAFSDDSEKKKYEDDVKKEDKLIEVRATPNKKVAVILNQDTDVTITSPECNTGYLQLAIPKQLLRRLLLRLYCKVHLAAVKKIQMENQPQANHTHPWTPSQICSPQAGPQASTGCNCLIITWDHRISAHNYHPYREGMAVRVLFQRLQATILLRTIIHHRRHRLYTENRVICTVSDNF